MTTETINVKGTNVNQALDEHHARLKAEAGEPTLEIQTSEPKTQVCWATKFVCRPGNFNDLVFERNKYGYLFIFKVK